MSSPQEKFIAALNIAFHPNTKEGDILAGIRGAARLLQGRSIADFLGFSPSPSNEKLIQQIMKLQDRLTDSDKKRRKARERSAELQQNLIAAELKLDDATAFIEAQSIEICQLKTEAAKAVETAVREAAREAAKAAPPPPKPSHNRQRRTTTNFHRTKPDGLQRLPWLIVCVAIIGGLIAATIALQQPAATVKQQAAAVSPEEKPKPEPAPTGTMQQPVAPKRGFE